MVTKNVTAPEPSKCTIIAKSAVATVTFAGSLPANFNNRFIIGLNVPASVRIPKNRMAKMNITPVGAIVFRPSVIKFIISLVKPAIRAVMIGTKIKATTAAIFFVITKNKSNKMVSKPRQASIFIRFRP